MQVQSILAWSFLVLLTIRAGLGAGQLPGLPSPKANTGLNAPDREAILLVRDLISQQPAKELTLSGLFKIRTSEGRRVEVPVTYSIHLTGTNWQSVYETKKSGALGPERLVVSHRSEGPNQYDFTRISPDGSRTNSMSLTGNAAAVRFAGTDFMLSDLGMEFLHWPQQRLVRDARITMRQGRPCRVLESMNPEPAPLEGYSRVVSWIDADFDNVVYAEAYDREGKKFKVFSLRHFTKVNGRWQVKDLELRDDKADTRTVLEFDYEAE